MTFSTPINTPVVSGPIVEPDEKKIRVNPDLEQNKSTGWMVKLVQYPRKILLVNLTKKLTMPAAINQIINSGLQF